jgi:hypothetical protein
LNPGLPEYWKISYQPFDYNIWSVSVNDNDDNDGGADKNVSITKTNVPWKVTEENEIGILIRS